MDNDEHEDVGVDRAERRGRQGEAPFFAAVIVLLLFAVVSTPVGAGRPMPELGRALDARHGLMSRVGDRHVVYFGVAGCGSVCPRTMLTLRETYLRVADPGRLHVTYVELGGRDDDAAASWARAFHPAFEGISERSLAVPETLAGLGVRGGRSTAVPHADGLYVLTRTPGIVGRARWRLSAWYGPGAIDAERLRRTLEATG